MSGQPLALERLVRRTPGLSRTRDTHVDVALGWAHLEALIYAAEGKRLLSPGDLADARGALGEIRRISRDFDREPPSDAVELFDAWAHRLHDLLGYRRAA